MSGAWWCGRVCEGGRGSRLGGCLCRVESAPDAEETKEMCKLLFDTALLTSGFSIDQPAEFAERVFKLMTQEANLESEKKSASIDPEVV